MKRSLIIMLHGVGSNGDDLAGLGNHWSPALPGAIFASPDAPFHFEHGGGYQWFSLNGITEQNRPARVAEAREAFDAKLQSILEAHQMSEQLHRIVLVGFSQGSIMALDALVTGRWPVAAVVAFSGRLASPDPLTPTKQTPALLIHGQADTVIPWAESESAALRLIAAGVQVKTQIEPTTGHTISAEGAQTAAQFIADCLK